MHERRTGELAPIGWPTLGSVPSILVILVLAALGLAAGGALGPSAASAQAAGEAITARHSGLCLGVEGGSTDAVDPVVQEGCGGGASQRWTTADNGDGTVTFRVDHTGQCLDIEGGSTADGARLIQYPCHGGTNQRFTLTPTGGGYATITASSSGKCLDIEGASTAAGAQLIQFGCTGAANQQFQVAAGSEPDPATTGRWGPVVSTPLVPVAGAALPNGDVLLWSAYERFTFGGARGFTQTAIFDPATSASSERQVSNTGHDMFCPGIATLADGRVMVNGGSNAAETSLYDPTTDSWQDAADMTIPRGYQATTLLEGGSAFTLGGSWSGGVGGKAAELWTDGQGWRRLSGVPAEPFAGSDPQGMYRSDNHMWLFGWTGGRVFHAGPAREMHWIDTAGDGSYSSAGNRADQGYAMNGNAVMYEPGRILTVGGADAYSGGQGTAQAAVVDITGSAVTSRAVGSMANRRTLPNSVVLPSGEVVVTGGQAVSNLFTDDQAVLAAEIWDPDTETFRTGASMTVPRTYHSISLLLPDGRVLVGGGGLCGSCSTNHPDVQIYSPPYLFDSAGTEAARPRIISAPGEVDLGEVVTVTTNREVAEFALVRVSSSTHSVNTDQRRIPLGFTAGSGNLAYDLRMPVDGGVAIPGSYWLFALDGAGVPSVAAPVIVTTDVADPEPPPGEAGAIGGSVGFGDGSLVSGVDVDLFEAEADGSRGPFLGSTSTGADGRYRFDVDPGEYVLTFIAPEGETFTNGSRWFQSGVTVDDGEEVLDVDATLAGGPGTGGSAVGGTVRSAGGAPEEGVAVDLFEANADGSRGRFVSSTRSAADGSYRFDTPPGAYVLTFIAPSGRTFTNGSQWLRAAVTLAAGEERLDVDATLAGGGGGGSTAMGGSVTDAGGPVSGVVVDLFETAADGSRGPYLGSVATGSDGRFRFDVAPGCYTLTFIAPAGRTFTSGSQWFQPSGCVAAGEERLDVDAVLS